MVREISGHEGKIRVTEIKRGMSHKLLDFGSPGRAAGIQRENVEYKWFRWLLSEYSKFWKAEDLAGRQVQWPDLA